MELAELVGPVVSECDGAGKAGLALAEQVRRPGETVHTVCEMARRHVGIPRRLSGLEGEALLADAPDILHQRFAQAMHRFDHHLGPAAGADLSTGRPPV